MVAQYRRDILTNNEVYHVYTRSIARFVVFNNCVEYERIIDLIRYYQFNTIQYRYSDYIDLPHDLKRIVLDKMAKDGDRLIDIIAYCIMPTHIHLILKQISENGISKFMSQILNSYSRFFNQSHGRVGPLWSGRFKNVLVSSDEQLLHLTRYLHLNPTSANLVNNPFDWEHSSCNEYIDVGKANDICRYNEILDIDPKRYKKFIKDQIDYQRKLSVIKHLLID